MGFGGVLRFWGTISEMQNLEKLQNKEKGMRRNFLSNSDCITTLETTFNVTFTVSLLNMYTYLQETVAKTSEYFVLIFTFFMSSNVYTTPKCLGTHNIRGD